MNFGELVLIAIFIPLGYSLGIAFVTTGKKPKPEIFDPIFVIIFWVAIYYINSKQLLIYPILRIFVFSGILGAFRGLFGRKHFASSEDSPVERTSPSTWHRVKHIWIDFADRSGNFQGRLILAIFYFVVTPPFVFILNVFHNSKKGKAAHNSSYWTFK